MLKIISIPILETNYTWVIYNHRNECIIIDPGEATKILNICKKFQLMLRAILLTHNHSDHVNGVDILLQNFPQTIIYGPLDTKNYGAHHILVSEGDHFTLLQTTFNVLSLPGHTLNHIGFYSIPWLFCGDTLFSIGCGKIYKGLSHNMYETFCRIKHLPKETLIFSGHEYTLSNTNFALSILPNDMPLINYQKKIIRIRAQNKPTIPTTLSLELKINPFLRCNDPDIKKSLHLPLNFKKEWQIFAELRKRKDLFQIHQL